MEALRQLYIDFIDEMDPYHDDEPAPETLEGLLYNLEEIRENNFSPNETDRELIDLLEKLNNIIGQFEAAGIRRPTA